MHTIVPQEEVNEMIEDLKFQLLNEALAEKQRDRLKKQLFLLEDSMILTRLCCHAH